MTKFGELIGALAREKVEFIIVGGVAATAHGAARTTLDLDVIYARSDENLGAIVSALGPFRPYLRGAPPGLPFRFDVETLKNGLNFTLTTSLGDIDLLGEIVGGGTYDKLVGAAVEIEVFGERCLCIGLEDLIRVKRAAGRPKDLEVIAELETLLELTRRSK